MDLFEALCDRDTRWICVFDADACRVVYANNAFVTSMELSEAALDEITRRSISPGAELGRIFSLLAEGDEARLSLPRRSAAGVGLAPLRGRVLRARHPQWGDVFAAFGGADNGAQTQEAPYTLRPDALARLSHALRGPLHVIAGFAELLDRAAKSGVDAGHDQLLADIIACANEALCVVDELHSLGRASADGAQVTPRG